MSKELEKSKDIETTISSFKPPIFWKEKEVVKQQLRSWSYGSAKILMYQVSEVELLIKKNSSNSVNILSNFIIEQVSQINN